MPSLAKRPSLASAPPPGVGPKACSPPLHGALGLALHGALGLALHGALGLVLLVAACASPQQPVTPEPVVEPPHPAVPEPPMVLQFAPVPPVLLRDVGLSGPAAALYDPVHDLYLVSNVNGEPLAHDDNGFISRVRPDGTVEELRWIDGARGDVTLDSPKGMALVGDVLYVADVDVVRRFNRTSGAAEGKTALVSATSLEDVAAAPDAAIFVSDSGKGKAAGRPSSQGAAAIYALDPRGVARVVAKGPELEEPRRLLAGASGVVVITASGALYRLSPAGAREPLGALPGDAIGGAVELPDGRVLVASAGSSSVYVSRGPLGAAVAFDVLIADLRTPGDLGFDPKRKQVLVPLVEENALYIQQVP